MSGDAEWLESLNRLSNLAEKLTATCDAGKAILADGGWHREEKCTDVQAWEKEFQALQLTGVISIRDEIT